MKRYALIALLSLLAACQQAQQQRVSNQPQSTVEVKSQVQMLNLQPQPLSSGLASEDNAALKQAFAQKQSHVWLEGNGVVKKLLPDDTKGARHQRFLVTIAPGQTLLFAHNIDLAQRADVNVGDQLQFRGEYIYNPKGGILHWTHHDPQGHQGGWISVNGQTYE